MKISIPKGFYEDKSSVTHIEFLEMFTEMVERVQELEEKLNYELETDFKYIHENKRLKEEIEQLKQENKKLKRGKL